jgi:hypothetical protein
MEEGGREPTGIECTDINRFSRWVADDQWCKEHRKIDSMRENKDTFISFVLRRFDFTESARFIGNYSLFVFLLEIQFPAPRHRSIVNRLAWGMEQFVGNYVCAYEK